MRKSEDLDILGGPIAKNLFLFIVPLLLTNFLQVLYSSADMFVVGMSHVDGAIGAIGNTTPLLHFIICICNGFALGSGVVVARRIGEGNSDKVRKTVHTSLIAGLYTGILFMGISLLVCKSILIWMGIKGDILHLSALYTTIYSFGIPFVSLTNCLIAIFRAKGDTKTPLRVLSFTGLLNVGMNILFVVCFRMSVDGVAIATVISNLLSSLILIYFLKRCEGPCRFNFKYLSFDKDSFKLIMFNGIPSAFQGALFSISNIMIQSCIVGINNVMCPGGTAVLDGHAASYTLEDLANQVSISTSQASVTFVSQHFGARDNRRMKKVIIDCYWVTALFTVCVAAFGLLLQKPVFSLLVHEELAMDTARLRTVIFLVPYLVETAMEMSSGILRGLDKARLAAIVTLVGACLFRIVWIFTVFRMHPTLECIYLSYPITWTITSVVNIFCIRKAYGQFIKSCGEKR